MGAALTVEVEVDNLVGNTYLGRTIEILDNTMSTRITKKSIRSYFFGVRYDLTLARAPSAVGILV